MKKIIIIILCLVAALAATVILLSCGLQSSSDVSQDEERPHTHSCGNWEDNGQGEYIKACSACGEVIAVERIYSYTSEGLIIERKNNADEYCVAGVGKCRDSVIVIPAEVNGFPVTEIRNKAFEDAEGIEAVIIPYSVTRIGLNAFKGSSVKRIFIPDGVTVIDSGAFAYCQSLTELILPNSLIKLGKTILVGSRLIERVIIPAALTEISAESFAYSSVKTLVLSEGIKKIGYSAFAHCTSLKEIFLPDSLLEIEMEAFSECLALSELTLPDGITRIGREAFADCTALISIKLPASLTSLSAEVFRNCTSLGKVEFNSALKIVDGSAFLGVDLSKTEILIPEDNKYLYMLNNALIGGNRDTVVIGAPDGTIPTDETITEIGPSAFIDRRDLKHIVIPKNITKIGGGAFSGCANLVSIRYEGAVAEWEKISLGVAWYNGYAISKVKCSDGEAEIEFKK